MIICILGMNPILFAYNRINSDGMKVISHFLNPGRKIEFGKKVSLL